MLKNLLLVGLGGFLGSTMRYTVWYYFRSVNFPTATLIVNILGSLIIGIVIGISIKDVHFSQNWKLFLSTGICGGFTTFSAFSLEVANMLIRDELALAAAYAVSSVAGSVLALFTGLMIIRTMGAA